MDWKAYRPGGGTPLYDAIGKGISKVNAQIEDGDHVLVTIITDGEENSSEEWTLKMVRSMIEKHLEFQQDEAGTKAMFARERRSRERYNCCVAKDAVMPVGSFFEEKS